MVIKLALQGALDDHLGQLAEQAALAGQLQPAAPDANPSVLVDALELEGDQPMDELLRGEARATHQAHQVAVAERLRVLSFELRLFCQPGCSPSLLGLEPQLPGVLADVELEPVADDLVPQIVISNPPGKVRTGRRDRRRGPGIMGS